MWFQWELDFLNWVNQSLHGNDVITGILRFITILGDVGFIWFFLGFILLFFKKTRKAAIVGLISICVVTGLNNFVIKILVNRARPFEVTGGENLLAFADTWFFGKGFTFLHIGELPSDASFMSGHTIAGFAFSTSFFFYHKKGGIICLVGAAIIALTRLYFCVHWPTDVIFGLLFAIALSIGICFLYNFIEKKIKEKIAKKKELQNA